MEILKFIFILGINFSIFGFIWGLIMFVIKTLSGQQNNESFIYIFRIVKYFLLVSVTAHFIVVYETGNAVAQVSVMHIVIGSVVLGLYLLGKLQNRAMLNQVANNPMFARFIPKVDPKMERFLLIGSILYFIACLSFPAMVNNGLTNWFTNSILTIYDTPVIGWIFKIIAFFFLITILLRGANVIGRLISGQSLTQGPGAGANVHFRMGGTQFDEDKDQYEDENGFSDYEDVTEDEDDDNKKD